MEIRLISESEINECIELHNSYYGKNRTAAQWRWEFARWKLPDGSIPYAIVRDGNRLVGTQALIPVKFIDKDGVFLTAKSEDTLIDPAYRGQNLFGRMYELLFQVARNAEIQCIWGFTPARGAFTKAGFEFPSVTSQLLLPLSSSCFVDNLGQQMSRDARAPLKRLLLRAAGAAAVVMAHAQHIAIASGGGVRAGIIGKVEIVDLESVPEEVGDLTRAFATSWRAVTIFRDAEYYRWRLRDNPHARSNIVGAYIEGKLVGVVAFILDKSGIGFVVDILVSTGAGADTKALDRTITGLLLRESARRLRMMGASCVRAWSVTDHPFDKLVRNVARAEGFLLLRRGHGVVRYTQDATDRAGPLTDMGQWYVTRLFSEGTDG